MTRGDALEALADVAIAVFDKTGTLTRGMPTITETHLNPERGDIDEAAALAIAAGLESHSAHPLARAFRTIEPAASIAHVQTVDHAGVAGTYQHQKWKIGSAAFAGAGRQQESVPGTSLWLADESGWVARFEVRDTTRVGAAETLEELRRRGVRVVIASGDEATAVERVARRLGVDEWHGRQSPARKMERVRDWQRGGARVLMVGDGVNDAPVLAAADVSMTVSGASDLANSAADFILTGESLASVTSVMDFARTSRRIVRQNLAWAIVYNAAAMPLAVAGLLQPWMAALGMSLSSLLVVANSARLSRASGHGARQSPPVGGAVTA